MKHLGYTQNPSVIGVHRSESNLANCCRFDYVVHDNLKQKAISASVYWAAALAMGAYYDAVYGAGPVTRHPLLVQIGVAGTFLFGGTALVSLWKPGWAAIVGILACGLCWSDFARIVPEIPFFHVFSIIGFAYWNEMLLALLILILASAYSLRQSWRVFRHPIPE